MSRAIKKIDTLAGIISNARENSAAFGENSITNGN
jgi:hypothetical protein